MSSYLVITEPARWSDSTGRIVRQVQIVDIRDTVAHDHPGQRDTLPDLKQR